MGEALRAIHVHFSSAFYRISSVDALHEIFSQELNPCPSRQRTISQSVLVLSRAWGLVTRLVSVMIITVIFGEITRPVTCQSLRQCRGTYFHNFSVLLTYSGITLLNLSVVSGIKERGSSYTSF